MLIILALASVLQVDLVRYTGAETILQKQTNGPIRKFEICPIDDNFILVSNVLDSTSIINLNSLSISKVAPGANAYCYSDNGSRVYVAKNYGNNLAELAAYDIANNRQLESNEVSGTVERLFYADGLFYEDRNGIIKFHGGKIQDIGAIGGLKSLFRLYYDKESKSLIAITNKSIDIVNINTMRLSRSIAHGMNGNLLCSRIVKMSLLIVDNQGSMLNYDIKSGLVKSSKFKSLERAELASISSNREIVFLKGKLLTVLSTIDAKEIASLTIPDERVVRLYDLHYCSTKSILYFLGAILLQTTMLLTLLK